MQKEFGRFNHTGKVFCKSNWASTKSILDSSIIGKISPIITLDLTDACNYNCEFCIDKVLVSEKINKEIDWNILSRLLPQAKDMGCRCLEISGGGEPTLYSHFADFITLSTNLGYRLALITNGSMLSRHLDILKDASFDWIRVSLDAGSEAMHALIHKTKTNYYNDILTAIEKLAVYHNVGISFLVTNENVSEIFVAAQKAKQLHAKYFEVKPLTQNYKSVIHNDKTKISLIEEQLLLAKELEDASFKVFFPTSLHDWIYQQKDYQRNYSKCLAAYYRSVITPSGVYVCPNHRGKNISERLPLSVDEMIKFRNREINAINPTEDCCAFCARSSINTLLYNVMDSANYNPAIMSYLGWPCDYGEDAIWI